MRVSGGGHDTLMILVPIALVFLIASGLVGGPDQLLRLLGGYVVDFLGAIKDWLRWTLF